MLGVVLQGEACAIFLREGTPVRSRKYKRTLVMKNTYHRERTNVPSRAYIGTIVSVQASFHEKNSSYCILESKKREYHYTNKRF